MSALEPGSVEIDADLAARLPPRGRDPQEWSSEEIVAFIELLLAHHDIEGVRHGMFLLARRDPHRAEEVRDVLLLGASLRKVMDGDG